MLMDNIIIVLCTIGFHAARLMPFLPSEMGWEQAAHERPEPLYSRVTVEFSMPKLIQDGPGENVRRPHRSKVIIRQT